MNIEVKPISRYLVVYYRLSRNVEHFLTTSLLPEIYKNMYIKSDF